MPANRSTSAGLEYGPTAILRNDWIDHERFRHRINDETGKAEFLRAIEQIQSLSIEIDTDFIEAVEWDLRINADILLDLNIYNGRLYVGSNTGLYHLDLDWESESLAPIDDTKKRTDAKCIHTTAKYGTVNASCGSDGWFSFLDDFDLGINDGRQEKHISEYSLRTAWLDFDIVNYPTTVTPTLFNSVRTAFLEEVIESKNNLEQEKWIVTDLEEQNKFDLNSLFVKLNSGNAIDPEDLQFVHNSSQALFLSTYNGELLALGLKRSGSSAPTVSYVRKYEGLGSLVSSIHTISIGNGPGLVLEMEGEVILFARRKFTNIFDSEVISIRTFARSKHYRNITSITTSNEVVLIATFDEEAY
ncbi:hypothetical protein H6G76_12910 [Nostoc sp. FACHB-152]|uniref:hypothetical protein n=1 Tax=unclassified Nostoc TaxID=2593658 RepID=UPI0016885F52|nr:MULTISPECIES: hypothetical protein [unclassified Nostoc]MBD2448051.1 hypothetical protein [Nostoc sp. FACHB-152]MBD2466158.1 hypothetical protein [Nostoc sp. FACHB-145]